MRSTNSTDRGTVLGHCLSPRGLAQLGVLAFALAAVASATKLLPLETVRALPGLCLFHRLTGWDCPGCGMGRALFWLARGDIRTAVEVHPASPFVLALGWTVAFLPARWAATLERSRAVTVYAPALAVAALLARWIGAIGLR